MRKKRFIAITVITIISMVSFMGCKKKTEETDSNTVKVEVKQTGYPIVDNTIKIKAVGMGEPNCGEWEDYEIFKEIETLTNVEIDWQTVSGDGADEKLNLILASKELPDAVFSGLSSSKISNYAQKGILIPIEDLIENYAPNIKNILDKNPNIRKAITMPDGHIYAVPSVNREEAPIQSTTLSINKTWLDKLNLKVPATIEEFEKVLEAFKTQDPNGNGKQDEIPFTYEPVPPYNIWNGDAGFSGAFGVTDSDSYLMMKDNQLVFTPVQDGYKEYVNWTAKLYEKGLIDREIFTQDHNQYMAKINSDRCGAYLTSEPIKTPNAQYITIAPLKGPNGDQKWASLDFSVDKNRGAITSVNKYPEATMRVIDSFYEPENTIKLRYGIYLEQEGEKYKVIPSVPGKSSLAPGPYVATCETKEVVNKYLVKTEEEIKKEERNAMYAPFLAEPVPLVNFTPEESKELSSLQTDLKKVVDESKAKWTTGQSKIESDWDSYIQSLNKMGLERYLELYNTALKRYQED